MRKIEERIIEAINNCQYLHTERDRVYPQADCVEVWLHSTQIASVYPSRVVIRTGGWRTATTKSRLNAILWTYCATGIYQKDFTWYLNGRVDARYAGKAPVYVEDGMSIPRKNKSWYRDKLIVSNL